MGEVPVLCRVRHFSRFLRSGLPLRSAWLMDRYFYLGIAAWCSCFHSDGNGFEPLADQSPAPLT